MSKKDLSRNPQQIDKNSSYYEENDGIDLVHRTFNNEGHPITEFIKIPWRKLKASLKRLEK